MLFKGQLYFQFNLDLKYEGKGYLKFRYKRPWEGKFILEGTGGVSLVGEGGRWLIRVVCFLPFSLFLTPFLSSPSKLLPCPVTTFSALPFFFPFAHAQLLTHIRLCWFFVHNGWYGYISPPLPIHPRLCPWHWLQSMVWVHPPSFPIAVLLVKTTSFVISPGSAHTACVGAELWASVWPPRQVSVSLLVQVCFCFCFLFKLVELFKWDPSAAKITVKIIPFLTKYFLNLLLNPFSKDFFFQVCCSAEQCSR